MLLSGQVRNPWPEAQRRLLALLIEFPGQLRGIFLRWPERPVLGLVQRRSLTLRAPLGSYVEERYDYEH
jgi:hypothetical protein